MKAALLTYSVSRANGGVYEVTRRAAQSLLDLPRMQVEVLGLEDSFSEADLPGWFPIRPKIFRHQGPRLCGYVPGLRRALDVSDPDVLHVHGIWSYYTLAGYAWSRRRGRPYLLTTHGMLSPYALGIARWKKAVGDLLFKPTVLRSARCLQALSAGELADLRRYGLRNPVCLIPNGIDLPKQPPAAPPPWQGLVEPGRKVLLYLGRLHPAKGLPALLRAWADCRSAGSRLEEEWMLAIAGWDQIGHQADLEAQVQAAGIKNSVLFLGPQFGESKAAAYHFADAFVLPSATEGLPMTVLEAWANRLPVLMTPECNVPEGFKAGAAVSIRTDPGSIVEGLLALETMTGADRREMGGRGRALVEERFVWPRVVAELRAVYEWLQGGGDAPSCVAFN